jgi:hypothetical protein
MTLAAASFAIGAASSVAEFAAQSQAVDEQNKAAEQSSRASKAKRPCFV